jgi:DNA-binding HxlR family transcriptional regulator
VTERHIPGTLTAVDDEPCSALAAYCPRYQAAVELVGRRWTGAIVRALLTGTTRFSELQAAVPGLSARLLSERLKELEAAGIVRRRVVPDIPVRVEYHLTEAGLELAGAVQALADWAEKWVKRRSLKL